jgi:hypothetical protein
MKGRHQLALPRHRSGELCPCVTAPTRSSRTRTSPRSAGRSSRTASGSSRTTSSGFLEETHERAADARSRARDHRGVRELHWPWRTRGASLPGRGGRELATPGDVEGLQSHGYGTFPLTNGSSARRDPSLPRRRVPDLLPAPALPRHAPVKFGDKVVDHVVRMREVPQEEALRDGGGPAAEAARDIAGLTERARWLRLQIWDMVMRQRAGTCRRASSMVEILTALYYGGIVRYRKASRAAGSRPRDRLEGHAAAALYPILPTSSTPAAEPSASRRRVGSSACTPTCGAGNRRISGLPRPRARMAAGFCFAGRQDGQAHRSYDPRRRRVLRVARSGRPRSRRTIGSTTSSRSSIAIQLCILGNTEDLYGPSPRRQVDGLRLGHGARRRP